MTKEEKLHAKAAPGRFGFQLLKPGDFVMQSSTLVMRQWNFQRAQFRSAEHALVTLGNVCPVREGPSALLDKGVAGPAAVDFVKTLLSSG